MTELATEPATSKSAARGRARVLVVMPLAEKRGGGEQMLLDLIEHGRAQGIDWVVAFFSDGPMVRQVREWGVEAVVVPTGRLRQPHRMALAVLRLRRLIRDKKIDMVFSWMGKAQLYGGTAAFLAGRPCMWYQLGLPDPPCWQDRVATLIPNRGALTCSNTATRAQAKLWPRRPTQTVYPGVDLSRFDPLKLPTPAECRRKLNLPTEGPLIGIVGRLQRWKGIHYLVEAMPAVLSAHPDAHAVIVGGDHAFEPEYPAFLDGRIAAHNVGERVIRAGLQSNVPEWMQAMDIVVHASDAEPFGIVVIEAMALGKPTVATATAGPKEIITDGVDGLLWPPGNVAWLAAALLKLLSGHETRFGKLAIKRASMFSTPRYSSNIVDSIFDAR